MDSLKRNWVWLLVPVLVFCAVLFVPHGQVSPWYLVAILACPALMAAMMFSMRDKSSSAVASPNVNGKVNPTVSADESLTEVAHVEDA
jgi:1,4-dihydroxy-2-naphthoate octaprenyltransferase